MIRFKFREAISSEDVTPQIPGKKLKYILYKYIPNRKIMSLKLNWEYSPFDFHVRFLQQIDSACYHKAVFLKSLCTFTFQLIGRPMLPPYWSLGFQLSRYGYNTLADLQDVLNRTREKRIPQVSNSFFAVQISFFIRKFQNQLC